MARIWAIKNMVILDNVKTTNRLAYLIGSMAVFILLLSFIDYAVSNWFVIEKVTITGNMDHINPKQLNYVAENKIQGNLFTLDINELQDEFRQIPWVKHITIYREFPNSITVGVSEYNAVARLGNDGLISADGKIFSGTEADDLPVFNVPSQNISEALTDYQLISKLLHKRQVVVKQLDINGLGITKVDLSNNLHIIICGTEIENQIKLLDQYWDKLYQVNPGLNYVNMCYKNALAINSISKPVVAKSESMAAGGN